MIAGGLANTNLGDASFATIGGGKENAIGPTANYATVPGGLNNTAAGFASFAAGRRAKANHAGSFVWGDSTDADFASTGANQFLIRANAVGIGTTEPDAKLTIYPYPECGYRFTGSSNSGGYATTFNMTETGLRIGHNSPYRDLSLQTARINRLTIGGDGNVGIGTTSPAAKLEIRNPNASEISALRLTESAPATSGDATKIEFFGDCPDDAAERELARIQAHNIQTGSHHGHLSFWTMEAAQIGERMRIDQAGNVGIGTTTPAAKLDVVGNIWRRGEIYHALWREELISANERSGDTLICQLSQNFVMNAVVNNPNARFQWYNAGGTPIESVDLTTLSPLMVLNAQGDVGIGVGVSPQAKLDVGGNVRCVSVIQTSDRNVKDNFAAVDCRQVLDRLAQVPIQTWTFTNDDAGTRHIGPMAQDFHAAFGVGPDDKHIATVDADGVALAAIQGLNQKLEDQLKAKETQIATLERRLAKLEKLLASLSPKGTAE